MIGGRKVPMAGLSWIRRFMYYPERWVPPVEAVLPGALDVAYDSADGLALRGWFLGVDHPAATVAVFHGNGGTRADRADLAAGLAERGMQVLLAEYRGYGECPGSPTEQGLIADGRAARAYLEGRPDVDPGRLVLFGESLGSGVAVALAEEDAPAALVLRSPFSSFAEIAAKHIPMAAATAVLPDRFDSLARIPAVAAPLLTIVGSRDTLVPPSSSRRLHEAAPGPKHWVEFPGAGHNDWEIAAGDRMLDEVAAFVAGVVGERG
jgi:fermentation-respiration switch protein FrsA (DUF1100 family)